MASTYATPVLFTKEKNVFLLYAMVSVGAAGAPTLNVKQSKGFCNVSINTQAFTANTATNTTLSVVSSFVGLYVGMSLTGTGIAANTVISSMNAGAGTITLNNATTATASGVTITAAGGYTFQLGQQAGVRLDTYNKILEVSRSSDLTGLPGAVGTAPSAPAVGTSFLIKNNIGIRTIPGTAASALTDASFTLMLGSGAGSSFVAAFPASGEQFRIAVALGNSTAP